MITKEDVQKADRAVEELSVPDLENGLFELFWVQKNTSQLVWDLDDPDNMQIAYATYAVIGELVELCDKVGWKIWKDSPIIDSPLSKEIAEEFADVLAFLGQLMVIIHNRTGVSPAHIAEMYAEKSRKNIDRFLGVSGEPGYNGVGNGKV